MKENEEFQMVTRKIGYSRLSAYLNSRARVENSYDLIDESDTKSATVRTTKLLNNSMRITIFILTLFLTTTVFGQTKDRRAELSIQGRVKEISVSPDEKIWLVTAIGNIYYTNNIDSNWHYGKSLSDPEDELILYSPNLERISFFNKDTAIMTGYISVNKEEYKKNGYYLTKDGGKTWELLDYGGDSWIYNTFVDKNGNAWMGGSSGEIYFSNDFGEHWKKLKSPYSSSSRMNSIFMINSTDGISGALHKEIYITSDNWKSSKKIVSPLEQNKYTPINKYSDDRIEKVLFWNNMIVVNQNGHIYYTEIDEINWKSFPIKVFDFEIDNESKILFAITDSLKIIRFTSPTEYQLLTDERLLNFPIDIKVINHSLFVISKTYDIYKLDKGDLKRTRPYTTDEKIADPEIVKQGVNLIWGANGNQIYLADDSYRNWHRENALDFSVADIMLLSDSIVILWDGVKDNYLYSLRDHTPRKYFPESPLKTFLAFPIKTFSINAGSQGCFHNNNNKVNYNRINDSTFSTTEFSYNSLQNRELLTFENKVNGNILTNILLAINSNPSDIPSLKDFQISEEDKKNYLTLVDRQLESKETDYVSGKKKIDQAFYYAVPAMLDTMNNSIIKTIFNQIEGMWSTTSYRFIIQIVNNNNDTLNISRNYYVNSLPWHLPWKFKYKGLTFNCYSIDFSRFIDWCIPEKFMDKDVFDNGYLIMQIADYLWNKEE